MITQQAKSIFEQDPQTPIYSREIKRGQKIYRKFNGEGWEIPMTSRQFKRIKEISLIIEKSV
jgi:hypothetical protein